MRPIQRDRPAKKPADRKIKGRERERWLADNQAAISAFNDRINRLGVFSDGLRPF